MENNCEVCPHKLVFEWAELVNNKKTISNFAEFFSERKKMVEVSTAISNALKEKSDEWLEKPSVLYICDHAGIANSCYKYCDHNKPHKLIKYDEDYCSVPEDCSLHINGEYVKNSVKCIPYDRGEGGEIL